MQITKIVLSPTGGTQKVLDILTEALATEQGAASEARQIDLADPFIDETDIEVAPIPSPSSPCPASEGARPKWPCSACPA